MRNLDWNVLANHKEIEKQGTLFLAALLALLKLVTGDSGQIIAASAGEVVWLSEPGLFCQDLIPPQSMLDDNLDAFNC